MRPSHFTPPDQDAIAHSMATTEHIRALLGKANWLSFYGYMQAALYAPGLGYYAVGNHKLGAGGDFTTAPEISPLFGQCVGEYCQRVLAALSDEAVILEVGAGSGRLAVDILQHLAQQQALPRAYWILEPSPDLRLRQQALLKQHCADYYPHIHWLSQPPTHTFTGVILGNEVLDALPVKRFVIQNQQPYEMGVTWDATTQRFAWHTSNDICTGIPELPNLTEDYISEYQPNMTAWLHSMTESLERGSVLWIDYGYNQTEYYHPERHEGTLTCFYQHQYHHDPFVYPGLQDITAHVNFTQVASAMETLGYQVDFYTTQTHFLSQYGIEQHFALLGCPDLDKQRQIRQLLLPEHMGEIFKAFSASKNMDQTSQPKLEKHMQLPIICSFQ